MNPPEAHLWIFIPMKDGRMKPRAEVFEAFQDADAAFRRHTGITWSEAFCKAEGGYPGEILSGPSRGSRILPAVIRSPKAIRAAA